MSEFQRLNQEYVALTGDDIFLYATQPDPNGPTKYIFADHQTTSRRNALEYLRIKVSEARQTGHND